MTTTPLPDSPLLSIIVVSSAHAEVVESPLWSSLIAQTANRWQLVVASASGVSPDARIVPAPTTGGVSLARSMNSGLAAATGDFVSFLSLQDELPPHTVDAVAELVEREPRFDIVYSDERTSSGQLLLKPVFSPERLRCHDYFGALTAYRKSLLDGIDGVRDGVPGAELYDLALRATQSSQLVERLPGVVVNRSTTSALDATAIDSTRIALTEHLEATGGGFVEAIGNDGVHRTHRAVVGEPLVSVIIPTRGDSAAVGGVDRVMVVEAIRSVIEKTTYPNFEFIVIIDDVAPAAVRAAITALAGDAVRFVEWTGPFSFSGKMNLGVVHSSGEYLLFLNDDVEVISPEWMSALLALAQLPHAGLAGAMLYFEDETIQHAGHAYYRSDVTHIGLLSQRGAAGPGNAFRVEREVDGATAACSMMPREVFFAAGGFSTLLPGNFNDVDLCMKIASLGYRSYWTPYAELYHYESKSRDPRVARYEIATAWGRWEHLFWDSKFWPEDPHTLYTA